MGQRRGYGLLQDKSYPKEEVVDFDLLAETVATIKAAAKQILLYSRKDYGL